MERSEIERLNSQPCLNHPTSQPHVDGLNTVLSYFTVKQSWACNNCLTSQQATIGQSTVIQASVIRKNTNTVWSSFYTIINGNTVTIVWLENGAIMSQQLSRVHNSAKIHNGYSVYIQQVPHNVSVQLISIASDSGRVYQRKTVNKIVF